MVGHAGAVTLASGDGNVNTDSQLVLGVVNVHVDTIALLTDTCIIISIHELLSVSFCLKGNALEPKSFDWPTLLLAVVVCVRQ